MKITRPFLLFLVIAIVLMLPVLALADPAPGADNINIQSGTDEMIIVDTVITTQPSEDPAQRVVVPPGIFSDLLAQIIVLLIGTLLSYIAYLVKKYLNITINLDQIKYKIAVESRFYDRSNITPEHRPVEIKRQLQSKLTPKENKIIKWVWGSLDNAIEHVFKSIIKPERIYNMVKKIGK